MTIIFKYKAIERPDGRIVKSPSIPVTLVGKGAQYDAIGLLDSGADISLMPKDLAILLGLDIENKSADESRGIGGRVRTIRTVVPIVVEAKRGHEKHHLSLPINVLLDGEAPPLLLGRAGFFDRFIITFDEAAQKITLKKNNPNNN